MIQRTRNLFILPFLAVALTACASKGQREEHYQTQKLVIERWHNCVDKSLQRLSAEKSRLDGMVKDTLVVCQGHKTDVLATFPSRMEKAVDNLMVEQVYASGMNQLTGGEIQGADLARLSNSLMSQY